MEGSRAKLDDGDDDDDDDDALERGEYLADIIDACYGDIPYIERGKSTLVRAQNRIVSSGRFRSLLHRFYASTLHSGNVSSLNNPYS